MRTFRTNERESYTQQFSVGSRVRLQGLTQYYEAPFNGQRATIERISTEHIKARYLVRFDQGHAFWVQREHLHSINHPVREDTERAIERIAELRHKERVLDDLVRINDLVHSWAVNHPKLVSREESQEYKDIRSRLGAAGYSLVSVMVYNNYGYDGEGEDWLAIIPTRGKVT